MTRARFVPILDHLLHGAHRAPPGAPDGPQPRQWPAQITQFGVAAPPSPNDDQAAPNGGSVSGYLHSATRRWPPGSPGYGPNVSSADLNIYTLPSRGPVVRICRRQGGPSNPDAVDALRLVRPRRVFVQPADASPSISLVRHGCYRASPMGWTAARTLPPFGAAVVLLGRSSLRCTDVVDVASRQDPGRYARALVRPGDADGCE
jgi:hypothetical protein